MAGRVAADICDTQGPHQQLTGSRTHDWSSRHETVHTFRTVRASGTAWAAAWALLRPAAKKTDHVT